jgi:hypothetical protein
MNFEQPLSEKYPPSEPCSCEVCANYCRRPGWWIVDEADNAIHAGYAHRMMLEMSPDLTFGVLSPAFKGCEVSFATNQFASNGCNFFINSKCDLHGTGHMPLECRFCHHDRPGQGEACHLDIEKEWNTPRGQAIVVKWCRLTGFRGI